MYFYIIAKLNCALVIDTEDRIVIIKDKNPLSANIKCQELVLRSLVNHSENQSDDVVENYRLLIEMLSELCLELLYIVLA